MSNADRGKVKPPAIIKVTPATRTIPLGNTGDGPLCPIEPLHGRTYSLPYGRFYCPHSEHFGNSAKSEITKHFFTDKEIH